MSFGDAGQGGKTREKYEAEGIHRGYKGSPCVNKNCLGCTMDPQLSLLRLLGTGVQLSVRLTQTSFL